MLRQLTLICLVLTLTACPGRAMNAAAKNVAEGLNRAIINQNDIITVRDGLPTYLLVVDGLIESNPDNVDLLMAGTRLYSMYAGSFVADPVRAQRLAARGHQYGRRLLCMELEDLCEAARPGEPFDTFMEELKETDTEHVPVLYTAASAWAGLIRANSGDWNAIADLPKIQAMMERVIKLDESYDHGNAHLYLGVLATQLPPDLGGRPEDGREHFERAIQLSDGRNLIAKVLYARHYARLVFDRELHDRLLREVQGAPAEVDGLTLSNTLAKQEAERLLSDADDYF
ncbi:MAG TPA: TRAP transporter TatT component family protein [Nevskiales bacterium]|nr:TRAP transporter TatT component family protein [Nevskiales bacterium]